MSMLFSLVPLLILWLSGPATAGDNLIWNGEFREWSGGASFVCGPTTGCWTADGWWVGPGVNGQANVFRIPFTPTSAESYLVIQWTAPMDWTGLTLSDGGRSTFLEYSIGGVVPFAAGRMFRYQFHALIASGVTHIVPILWFNYHNGDYEILACPEVVIHADSWTEIDCRLTMPDATGHQIDRTNYLGIGVAFPYRTAPTLVIHSFSLTLAGP